MVTQLQDINNQVAQEKISNSRLRNEEIRRNMTKPWSAPVEPVSTGTQPTSLVNVTSRATGTQPTLASTYSGLKSNLNTLGLNSAKDNADTTYGGNTNWKSQGWIAPLAGQTAGIMGAGPYSGLASAATSLMQGNKTGAVGSLSSTLTNIFNKGKIPGLGGAVGTLASGLMGEKSMQDIGMGLFNSGLGSALSVANPVLGTVYGLARMAGFDPAYGLNNLFGNGMQGVAPGFGGTAGGFLGKNAEGRGIKSTMSNVPGMGYTNSGSAGYTPPGYTQGTLGTGITTNAYSGMQGGLSNMFSGYSPSSDSSDSSDSGGE